jgi:hypothetical protein
VAAEVDEVEGASSQAICTTLMSPKERAIRSMWTNSGLSWSFGLKKFRARRRSVAFAAEFRGASFLSGEVR